MTGIESTQRTGEVMPERDFLDEMIDRRTARNPEFPRLRPKELGFYPLVDRTERVQQLVKLGVKSIQLRIKDLTGSLLDHEIRSAVEAAKRYDARLWVNDHWELAIRNGAFGVHLGQEDLAKADFEAGITP